MKEILYYTKENGKSPYVEWFQGLDTQTKIRVASRIERLIDGHYGETRKLVNSDLSELKFKFGKGYRIYYIDLDEVLILFLSAGDKSNQKNDIKQAENYYKNYIERLQ
jgi:putative addiction module killer protein